jgi:hypothetical protein
MVGGVSWPPDRQDSQPRMRSKVTSRPSTPPGPTLPLTSVAVMAFSYQPCAAVSFSNRSSLGPLILPPIIFSRISTTLYSYIADCFLPPTALALSPCLDGGGVTGFGVGVPRPSASVDAVQNWLHLPAHWLLLASIQARPPPNG